MMKIKNRLFMILTLCFLAFPFATNAQQYTEGEDYQRMDAGQPRDAQMIEVVEFFAYACPYCARVEMPLAIWHEMKPENVTYTRIAIPRNGRWETYAKAYYALQAIDPALELKLLPEIMKTVVYHRQNLDNDADFIDWAEKQGVNRQQFAALMASKEIAQKVEDALLLSQQYGVPSVPAIYVDGRYQLIHNNTYYEKIPLMLNALIAQAWEERAQDDTETSNQPEEATATPYLFSEDAGACSRDAGANACQ